jgi:His-Xaa-Ser system radical SAM maturase HxsC
MLKLHGKIEHFQSDFKGHRLLYITNNTNIPEVIRSKYALLVETEIPEGYGAYFSFNEKNLNVNNFYHLKSAFNYLLEGDIVRVDDRGNFATLFRVNSTNNTILLTTRCNHYCLMCSQPPTTEDDSWIFSETMNLLEMIPDTTKVMGYSGGEPTLYGDDFVRLIKKTKDYLPNTVIDVLTNGRAFSDYSFSKKIETANHPNCTFGIPLYSYDPVNHDYIVQARGAFDETIKGIVNLKKCNQRVEIRIVIHKQTIKDLIETCSYIARNLLFVDHVALMGLEITGFTRANLDKLWIDPYEYKDILSKAVNILNSYKIETSVYNHQICTVNNDVMENYHQSISDWKNEYVEECEGCTKRNHCGGFFSSSKKYKYSKYINAIT